MKDVFIPFTQALSGVLGLVELRNGRRLDDHGAWLMLLTKDQMIAGVPATELRKLMKKLSERAHSAGALLAVCERLGFERDVEEFLGELEGLGFIQPMRSTDVGMMGCRYEPDLEELEEVRLWTTTIGGQALGKAKVGKPMTRAKALERLGTFLERVHAVNADDNEAFVVNEVKLYGSLADETRELIGDVDLWVDLGRRDPDGDAFIAHCRRLISEGLAAGKNVTQGIMRITWPETDLHKRLKAGDRKLDVEFNTSLVDPDARTIYVRSHIVARSERG